MAADDFTITPTIVIPEVPDFYIIITPSESVKKNYQLISTNSTQKWRLIFKAITNTVFVTIQAHYAARYGQYDNFLWTTVPSYIDTDMSGTVDGTSMTGRWVNGSLSVTPLGALKCNCELVFEKDV